jgi:O-antigen/teichoic acid export membrane protein
VEGTGEIVEVYLVRFFQAVSGSFIGWILIYFNFELYALSMPYLFGATVASLWLIFRKRIYIKDIFFINSGILNWCLEVWPLQWRGAINWLSGYVLVLMYVPLIYWVQGPVQAGQMGVSMTCINTIAVLSMSLLTARIPLLSKSAILIKWHDLDVVFNKTFKNSVLIYICGATGLCLLVSFLSDTVYAKRFLPIIEILFLLVALFFYHCSNSFLIYLKLHFKDPTLSINLTTVLLTLLITFFVAPHWGTLGISISLMLINSCFLFPFSMIKFIKLKEQWHKKIEHE